MSDLKVGTGPRLMAVGVMLLITWGCRANHQMYWIGVGTALFSGMMLWETIEKTYRKKSHKNVQHIPDETQF